MTGGLEANFALLLVFIPCGLVSILSDPSSQVQFAQSQSGLFTTLRARENLLQNAVYYNAPIGVRSCPVVANQFPALSDIYISEVFKAPLSVFVANIG